jgi:predicted dehydrogenase
MKRRRANQKPKKKIETNKNHREINMKKIAFVGASMRSRAFVRALKKDYAETHQLCAVMDIDDGKMRGFNESIGIDLPRYTDFDQMCDETRPDLLLISTVDYFHRDYIVKSLDRKIAFICEKPLCVNIEQCRDIITAQKRNPEVSAATSHNARYHVMARTIKRLLDEGAIGRVNSVNYAEMLDFEHGTSYFRRWNRKKELSGGLQIHKSSHHFDKLNWWLNSHVAAVNASGALRSFGADASPFHGENCETCPHTAKCRFVVDYEKKNYIDFDIFMKYRSEDSYIPNKCVFSPEIDIEDFLNVGLAYENGVSVNYTLAAHCNYEGETIIFEGDKGRLEMICRYQPGHQFSSMEIFRFGQSEPEKVEIKLEEGSHGGADNRLYEDLFGEAQSGQLATLEDGIQAVLAGIAVNKSLETGSKVDVQSLL